MNIAMIGSGYVGLVSGACFADFGHAVTCVDMDAAKIEALQRSEIPIFEPGLDRLVHENQAAGRLSFTTDLPAAVGSADVVFIAVGTPSRRGDGHADLSYVRGAAAAIGRALDGFTVVVTKSTVPVGTGDEVERIILESKPGAEVAVVSNPEFLREGAAIDDFHAPDRIVIGTDDPRARAVMGEVYRPLEVNHTPVFFTSRRTAELTKYAANAFLAMKITFINEVADLCEKLGADVAEVAQAIGADQRIGAKFLNAGPGFGGSCFPKDTLAFAKIGQDFASPMRLVETTVSINDQRKRSMGRKIIESCGGSVRGKRVAIAGLTFKPDTDDMREAPSLAIIQALLDGGAEVVVYDPHGMEATRALFPAITCAVNVHEAARGADCLAIVTEWNEFRSLDFSQLHQLMRTPTLVDLRNVYSRAEVEKAGFRYECVGRPAARR